VWKYRRPLRYWLQCGLWKMPRCGVIFIFVFHSGIVYVGSINYVRGCRCGFDYDSVGYAIICPEGLRRWKLWKRSDLPRISVRRLLFGVRLLVSPESPQRQRQILILSCSGSSIAFCATGCQSGFGKCGDSPAASTVTPSPPASSTPTAPSLTCGVEGFANDVAYYASSFNLINTTDVKTCATLCLAEPTCNSYLFNPKLGNCAYLVYSLVQGQFIATGGTNQLFWERACAQL
jgi:hypothetical protein